MRKDPIGVLRLGLEVRGYGLKSSAVRWISSTWKDQQLAQLFVLTASASLETQCAVLAIMSKFTNLDKARPPLIHLAHSKQPC